MPKGMSLGFADSFSSSTTSADKSGNHTFDNLVKGPCGIPNPKKPQHQHITVIKEVLMHRLMFIYHLTEDITSSLNTNLCSTSPT